MLWKISKRKIRYFLKFTNGNPLLHFNFNLNVKPPQYSSTVICVFRSPLFVYSEIWMISSWSFSPASIPA